MIKKNKLYWTFSLAIIIIISYFSLTPHPFTQIGLEEVDKIDFNPFHVLAYFSLGIFLGLALYNSKNRIIKTDNYIFTILFCLSFSFLIELLQIVIPGRSFSLLDIIYNFVGISLAQIMRLQLVRKDSS